MPYHIFWSKCSNQTLPAFSQTTKGIIPSHRLSLPNVTSWEGRAPSGCRLLKSYIVCIMTSTGQSIQPKAVEPFMSAIWCYKSCQGLWTHFPKSIRANRLQAYYVSVTVGRSGPDQTPWFNWITCADEFATKNNRISKDKGTSWSKHHHP